MKKSLKTLMVIAALFLATGAGLVEAQPTGGGNPPTGGGNPPVTFSIPNPFKQGVGDSLYTLIQKIMDDIVMPLGAVLCVLAFIYAGFKYVMAQGNKTAIEEANRMLLYAAIGTAVLLGSWVLARAICNTVHALGGPVCPV